MYTLICYPKCSTCKKAEDFLKNNNIKYNYRNIKEEKLKDKELDRLVKLSKKDIKNFFNVTGLVYRKLNLKDKLLNMNYEEKLKVLSSDGMLVKRPILVADDLVFIGFDEKVWSKLIK